MKIVKHAWFCFYLLSPLFLVPIIFVVRKCDIMKLPFRFPCSCRMHSISICRSTEILWILVFTMAFLRIGYLLLFRVELDILYICWYFFIGLPEFVALKKCFKISIKHLPISFTNGSCKHVIGETILHDLIKS